MQHIVVAFYSTQCCDSIVLKIVFRNIKFKYKIKTRLPVAEASLDRWNREPGWAIMGDFN